MILLDGHGRPRHLAGVRASLPHHLLGAPVLTLPTVGIPDAADTRQIAETPVRDQESDAACVGFGICDGVEYALKVEGVDAELSELGIWRETREIAGTANQNTGVTIPDGISVAATRGILPAALWPYDPTKYAEPIPAALATAARYRIGAAYRCPDMDTTLAAIAQGFRIVFGLSLTTDFMSQDVALHGEVPPLKANPSFAGAHCMSLVAYDKKRPIFNEVGVGIAKNSWGPDWAKQGYCYIPLSYLEKLSFDRYTVRIASAPAVQV